jgi:hypothetical protein
MNAPATTPATETTEVKDSALTVFIKSLPKTKPNKTDQKAAAAKFKAFAVKKAAAIAAVNALAEEEQEVAKEAVKAFGKETLIVDGQRFAPTSRDGRIFYKNLSGAGVEI